MKVYGIYGTNLDLKDAKKKLEELCSLDFEEHISSYYGVYYISGNKYKGESYQLINNIDLLDNEPLEESGFSVILYINNIQSNNDEVILSSQDFFLISKESI